MTEPNHLHNVTDEGLIETILALEEAAKIAESEVKKVKLILLERKQKDVAAALKQKPEPFGAVSQIIGDMKVTITTPKKVEWNQEGLATLYAQIAADPDEDVREYIGVEYKVKEDAYKNWPSNLKETFEPHRTLKSGTVSLKIEPAKEK